MIPLTILTLGIYMNYWVHVNAIAINRRFGCEQVSMKIVWAYWAVTGFTFALVTDLILTKVYEPHLIDSMMQFVDKVHIVFTLIVAFAIRGGLDAMLPIEAPNNQRFKGLWTFLFNVFYLQWKVNRHLESGVFQPAE
ncbi:hypothetical protein [Aeoliella mucimassa]|nr:hypothetical protein [Aeoliella mucimassa]